MALEKVKAYVINRKKSTFFFAVVFFFGFRGCVLPHWSNVRPFTPDCEAAKYVSEYRTKVFPTEVNEYDSPDGTAKIVDDSTFMIFCHTVWVKDGSWHRRKIIRVGEADPGSGINFRHGWSKDSQAVFFGGTQYGGRWCRDLPPGTPLRLIYTRKDGVAWQLPNEWFE